MRNVSRAYAVECGGVVPESELSPAVRAILERMARVAYVLDCHRAAVAKHSRTLAELRSELEALEVRE